MESITSEFDRECPVTKRRKNNEKGPPWYWALSLYQDLMSGCDPGEKVKRREKKLLSKQNLEDLFS